MSFNFVWKSSAEESSSGYWKQWQLDDTDTCTCTRSIKVSSGFSLRRFSDKQAGSVSLSFHWSVSFFTSPYFILTGCFWTIHPDPFLTSPVSLYLASGPLFRKTLLKNYHSATPSPRTMRFP